MITLFKAGDFFEAYNTDAVTLARELGVTLTTSRDGRKMAGIPYWALDRDTQELKDRGFTVIVQY